MSNRGSMTVLPVSLYFMPEWWDVHFHALIPRPDAPSRPALEAMYLDRQRFLFEQLGAWGCGQEDPELGPGQIATVIRYGFDLVPALLGTRLDFTEAWGFYPRFRGLDEVRSLQAVDVAQHAEGEWLIQEAASLRARYGGCLHCLDLGSVTNNAFRILGESLYAELIANPTSVTALFEVILQTMEHLYTFLDGLFGPTDPVPISNCNVSLMGPRLYGEVVLPFDARQNRFAEHRFGCPPRAAVHHCDVPADLFLTAYARLPGVASLQAAVTSDLAAARQALPHTDFSALVSPGLLSGKTDLLRDLLRRALAADVADLALWNIDAGTSPEEVKNVLEMIRSIGSDVGRSPVFSALPLCWDEIEWAHGRYQGQNLNL